MILYALGVFLQSKCILVILILFSELVVLVLSILCGVAMILLTLLADVCMQPTQKFASLVPGSLKDVILYFGECSVDNPYASSISSASDAMNEMADAINSIGPLCESLGYASEKAEWWTAGNDTVAVSDSIDKLNDDLDCPTLQSIYNLLIKLESLCTNLFGGFYKLWISEYLVSTCCSF